MEAEKSLKAQKEGAAEASRKTMEMVRGTEGFARLTPRQQKIIRQSFYIQSRASRISPEQIKEKERAKDLSDKSWSLLTRKPYIERTPEEMRVIEEGVRAFDRVSSNAHYQPSVLHIRDWYCHVAIQNLEREQGLYAATPERPPAEFFDAEYRQYTSAADLRIFLENFGFPSVLFAKYIHDQAVDHTCLVLGHNSHGDIIVWEKEDAQRPYQTATLDEVFTRYAGDAYSWGFRALRNAETSPPTQAAHFTIVSGDTGWDDDLVSGS